MTEQLVMPRLSDTMESGTVSRWMKGEGEAFVTGDVLAEIETDKAVMELSAYDDGVLLKILVADGESADLGAPIAVVGADGEDAESEPSEPRDAATEPEAPAVDGAGADRPEEAAEPRSGGEAPTPAEEEAAPAASPVDAAGLKASPIARRMAAEAGLDLRSIAGQGSGPDGRIVKVDVERLIDGRPAEDEQVGQDDAARSTQTGETGEATPEPEVAAARPERSAPPARPAAEGTLVKPSRMLQTVARRMAQSKQTAPHFYLETSVDMTNALAARRQVNSAFSSSSVKVSVNDLMLRASGLALLDHPQFHRSWTDEGILQHAVPNVGMAVALDDGLIVPVVRDIAAKSLRAIAAETKDLASRAREGRLKQDEIEGGTFTVSNLGMFGITRFHGIINLPEPGILSVAATVDTPVVVDRQVVIRPMMALSLSVDHRAASGADGARFLATVKRILESGAGILA